MEKNNFNKEVVNICDVHIDVNLPVEERYNQFISKIKNPYHFRNDEVEIEITYTESGNMLRDILKSYLITNK